MRARLTPDEKRLRRRERLRLIAYLHRGGRLIREDLPAGVVAWAKESRSGPCFSMRAVYNLMRRGAVIRGDKYVAKYDDLGKVYMEEDYG